MTQLRLTAVGLYAALIVCILALVAIALFGQGALAETISKSLVFIAALLAGGLVVDLGFKKRNQPGDKE